MAVISSKRLALGHEAVTSSERQVRLLISSHLSILHLDRWAWFGVSPSSVIELVIVSVTPDDSRCVPGSASLAFNSCLISVRGGRGAVILSA